VDNALPDYTAHVLIAGADAAARTHMLEELTDQLPAGTLFAHANETWEVIAAAATSNMVVLAGDLGEMSGESMMRLLGRRYPTLPVLAVAEKTPTHPAADVDVAHA
jgi:DNA-binding NtrC family response regulator